MIPSGTLCFIVGKALTGLIALAQFYDTWRVMPSYRELAKRVGLKSPSGAHALVSRLKDAGFIVGISPGGRIAPTRAFIEYARKLHAAKP